MPNASPAVALLYSGGSGNSNPALSLGGPASTTSAKYAVSQNYTASAISGIAITHAARNPVGTGYLSFTKSNNSVTWLAPGGASSSIGLSGSGWYAIGNTSTGWLRMLVDFGALPSSDTGQSIVIEEALGTLFSSPSAGALQTGVTDYRALYLHNQSTAILKDVTLTLTDSAPASALYVGSTYNPLSTYATPAAEALDFGMSNLQELGPPFETSIPTSFLRESLASTTLAGLPRFPYFPSDLPQESDGAVTDVEVQIVNATDPTNLLSAVAWGSSLYWAKINPGKMVSFWVKRVVPPNPPLPTIERVLLDVTFTGS